MLVRFFRSSFAGQFITAGIFGVIVWATVLPDPPPMPVSEGPAIFYGIVYKLLAGYPLIASITGMVAMILSAFWLNQLLTKHEIVPKNSSLAAFLFILVSCWHPMQMTLTPVTISMLFFLSVIQSLFQAYTRQEPTDLAFSSGFMTANAALFYPPAIFFYGFLLTTFLVYRTVKWREWAGSFIGLITPMMFLVVYWFWTDSLVAIVNSYGEYFRQLSFSNPWRDAGTLVPVLFIVIFLIAGASHNFSHLSEKTVETRKKLILLNWFAIWVIATLPFAGGLIFYHPELVILPVVPFLTNLYLSRKKTFLWELLLWGFILLIAVNQALNLIN